MSQLILIILSAVFISGCTSQSQPSISESEYAKNTQTMLNVTNKFMNDSQANRLHRAAVNFQLSRAVTCEDVGDECSQYREFVSKVISYSEDGELAGSEKVDLYRRHKELDRAVLEGKKLLSKQWEDYFKNR